MTLQISSIMDEHHCAPGLSENDARLTWQQCNVRQPDLCPASLIQKKQRLSLHCQLNPEFYWRAHWQAERKQPLQHRNKQIMAASAAAPSPTCPCCLAQRCRAESAATRISALRSPELLRRTLSAISSSAGRSPPPAGRHKPTRPAERPPDRSQLVRKPHEMCH